MSNIIGGSFIKEGKASLEITADDLFDKIINLKFTRTSGRSFTIRSDYEAVPHKNGTVSFQRCAQKPDIKIGYRQVAESVAIEVDIRITNLFIDGDKESAENMNTVTGDPVEWCTIQMGYRAQFPDWTKAKSKDDIKKFYALDNGPEIKKYNQIQAQILTGYPESYPPDKVTYFKGIIGSMEYGLRWKQSMDELKRGYGDPETPKHFSEIEDALFQLVTRRFVRSSVKHIAVTKRNFTNREEIDGIVDDIVSKRFEQQIRIHKDECINTELAAGASSEDEYIDLPFLENSLMSVENANKFGVTCIVSETLRRVNENSVSGHNQTPEEADAVQDAEFIPFNEMYNTIGGQLRAIQKHYKFLRWYMTMEGNYYFYHVDDTDTDLLTDPYIKALRKANILPLPAIYDMTLSGTRTIRCPFISFLSPMMTVCFQSRYTIGSLVGYFYTPSTNKFLVITASVSFATVQEDNLMELMCVDDEPKSSEDADKAQSDHEQAEEEVTRKQQGRNMKWSEKELTVVLHRTNATETESSWENIARNDVFKYAKPERFPEGTEITVELAAEALVKWNPKYTDPDGEYMARSDSVYGESIENRPSGIGGRIGKKLPWLRVGDKITVHRPFQSEYPEDEKVEVV